MQDALDFLARERCSAILRTTHPDAVVPAMEAAVEGGFRAVEFTLTTPGALEAVTRFRENPQLLVGAGTVLTKADAKTAVDAGAQFLVSPVIDPELIRWAVENDVLIIPGSVFSARDTHFRISYAADDAVLERGVERLRDLARER